MAVNRMAGRGERSVRLLAGSTGRSIIGLAASSEDSASALAGGVGLPGTQGRTGLGSLRRTALAGGASSCDTREPGVCIFTPLASPSKKKHLVRCSRRCLRLERGYRFSSFAWQDSDRGAKRVLITPHDT